MQRTASTGPTTSDRRWKGGLALTLVAVPALVAPACSSSDSEGAGGSDGGGAETTASTTEAATSETASGPVCGYYYEWKRSWRFALQPDPHAAYSYVIPKVTTDPIGFLIEGPFPYAPWTSWTIYDAEGQPYSIATDNEITPDDGSENPFVVGTPVLSEERDYPLLVLPDGTDPSSLAEPLQDIPSSNVLASPTSGDGYISWPWVRQGVRRAAVVEAVGVGRRWGGWPCRRGGSCRRAHADHATCAGRGQLAWFELRGRREAGHQTQTDVAR